MAHSWSLYQRSPAFILGFHGNTKETIDAVLDGTRTHLGRSKGRFEWLGHGIYFWENDPQRGLEWAEGIHSKKKSQDTAVVGAIIDLGLCLIAVINTECIKGYFRPLQISESLSPSAAL